MKLECILEQTLNLIEMSQELSKVTLYHKEVKCTLKRVDTRLKLKLVNLWKVLLPQEEHKVLDTP